TPPLLPPSRCTNTADRRWRRCHDTVACRPTNPSQSASQQAPSYPLGVNLHLNPHCLPAHPSTPALCTLYYRPPLPPQALRVTLSSLTPPPLPHSITGIGLNSHRAA
ncbi:hypothetical protein KUCAC02_030130, partial [Chaenocephalus aceratus]